MSTGCRRRTASDAGSKSSSFNGTAFRLRNVSTNRNNPRVRVVPLPPDGAFAAGPNHVVGAVNTAYKVWSKSGQQLLPATDMGLFFLGCNDVTRHDAAVSVRAGFREAEISAVWPSGPWSLREEARGLFSHLFVARRNGP